MLELCGLWVCTVTTLSVSHISHFNCVLYWILVFARSWTLCLIAGDYSQRFWYFSYQYFTCVFYWICVCTILDPDYSQRCHSALDYSPSEILIYLISIFQLCFLLNVLFFSIWFLVFVRSWTRRLLSALPVYIGLLSLRVSHISHINISNVFFLQLNFLCFLCSNFVVLVGTATTLSVATLHWTTLPQRAAGS